MNSEHKNRIDSDLIKRYFDGTLNDVEKNRLEQMALDDPFLQDAMDGFEASPESFAKFYEKYAHKNQTFHSGYFVIGGIVTIALILLLVFLNPNKNEQEQTIVYNDSLTKPVKTEIDLVPQEIDTLESADEIELIKAAEIVIHKKEILKSIQYPDQLDEEPIVIDEDIIVPENYEIKEDGRDLTLIEHVPATYLFDLFVVDYRRIDRKKTIITYTKFEFSGTSAEYENEYSKHNTELLERQVDVPYFDYLNLSMEYFSQGDYKKSLTRYLTILEQYTDDANALFYGGLCYYNLKKYDKSLLFFDKLLQLDLNAFKEEAKWYKAKTLIKLGRTSDAKKVLDEIIAGGGHYVVDAIQLKKSI